MSLIASTHDNLSSTRTALHLSTQAGSIHASTHHQPISRPLPRAIIWACHHPRKREFSFSVPTLCANPDIYCFQQMLTSILSECSPRLIALGGYCPDHSDAIYANTVPAKFSKSALISHGVWITKRALAHQQEQEAEAHQQRQHFS